MGTQQSQQKHWVLLAAGSNGWDNYRHQADVCHAYQIAHRNGIPDDHIVVMMYDDIASHQNNPTKEKIINKPDGPNDYAGVPKDYTGGEVTVEIFRAVLKGNRSVARKKVLQCEDGDSIFIYMSDHGDSGVFAFPDSTLYACDFIQDMTDIAQNKPSSEIVVFMESCKSGSMLMGLPTNVQVYGITASKPDENSFACYYDDTRKTYLADVFSAAWMHYVENTVLTTCTLAEAYTWLTNMVTTSTPCQYGNMSVSEMPISTCLGQGVKKNKKNVHKLLLTDHTESYKVPLLLLRKQIEAESNKTRKWKLTEKLNDLEKLHKHIDQVALRVEELCSKSGPESRGGSVSLFSEAHLKDLKAVSEHFRSTCFDWHNEQYVYALSKLSIFSKFITFGLKAERIMEAITEAKSST